ncbi:hypothetical protein B0I03_10220 [Flavobacterium aquaticum]|uniref:Uncharacterized protein n=1 Tax=Flavobacterium aquaticum TaxID=1236486 RepID=A0A327YUD7_9FLAO|nr:hypothetical protein [Flavobacterium aquaticum]RAK24171.1 hypothetical protein B0I03_10220 [Flavobacterium aquaticum]
MKFYTLFFLFISPFIFSQNEVGLPLNDIKNRFKDSKYNLEQIVQEDGSVSLSVKLENAYATYYFDNDSYQLSNTLVITPDSQKSLERFIKEYNSKYKRANSTNVKWLVETKLSDEISIIETIHLSKISAEGEDDFYVLIWTFEK